MWNQVKIDGKWYIVDSTWGDSGDKADDWFLLIGSDSVKDEHHTVENYDFVRTDENGNLVPVTEYACMPAPAVEKTDYVYPGKLTSTTEPTNTLPSTTTTSTTTTETSNTGDNTNTSITPDNSETKSPKTVKKNFKIKKGKTIKLQKGTWKVKNKKIVSVSKSVVVKGKKKGKTTITGKIKGVSYRYIVTVK